MYYTFILILCCFFFLVIFFIIYTSLHLNRGSVIWKFFYYLVPISFAFIFCNNSVYFTFIFILRFFLIIIFFIYTSLLINKGSVIWALLYYLIQGITIILFLLFSNNSVNHYFLSDISSLVFITTIWELVYHHFHSTPISFLIMLKNFSMCSI